MNILIKKLRKNCSKIAAMAVISAVVVVIILVSRVRVDANNSYGRDYSDKRYKNYTVTSGDTLWDIAEANMDYEYYDDVNDYIAEIKRMNNLYSDKIYTGQNLLITYYFHNCNTLVQDITGGII